MHNQHNTALAKNYLVSLPGEFVQILPLYIARVLPLDSHHFCVVQPRANMPLHGDRSQETSMERFSSQITQTIGTAFAPLVPFGVLTPL